MKHCLRACVLGGFLVTGAVYAQTHIVGIGDSLGEGDQSANAFTDTQQQSYLAYIASQSKIPFQLPLIKSNLLGFVGVVANRSRISPGTPSQDLAVSGATVSDVLNTVAHQNVQTEADLVLSPYFGMSQIQAAESLKPGIIYCWVGNDDVINYVLDFSHLNNPSGITPLSQFTTDYQQLIARLKATGSKVVVGNIPDLTKVAFLFNNDDLTRYTGTNYNLPSGSYTTLGAVMLFKLGMLDATAFSDPAYVLTAAQITNIQTEVAQYNDAIKSAAYSQSIPVVDTFAIVDSYITKPVTIGGITISLRFNGGAFSLDGIHPSDTGYALFANAFIKATNTFYQSAIPTITNAQEQAIVEADPYVDHDGNGVVPGRVRSGLLETLAPILGFSGDKREGGAGSQINRAAKVDPHVFMSAYYSAIGKDPNTHWEKADVMAAVKQMLGSR